MRISEPKVAVQLPSPSLLSVAEKAAALGSLETLSELLKL